MNALRGPSLAIRWPQKLGPSTQDCCEQPEHGRWIMALKNLEEAIVERIRRAVVRELKAWRRRAGTSRNGHTQDASLNQQADAMGDGRDGR
jgi:hypothetical protein